MQPKAKQLKALALATGWVEDKWGHLHAIRPQDNAQLRLKFTQLTVRLERQIPASTDTFGHRIPASWIKINTSYDADISLVPGNPPGLRIGRYIIGADGKAVTLVPRITPPTGAPL